MNGQHNGPPDPIAKAIDASEKPAVVMAQVNVTIASTGRPVVLGVPQDMTESELFELVGWMATSLRTAVREQAGRRGPQLVVARGLPPTQ